MPSRPSVDRSNESPSAQGLAAMACAIGADLRIERTERLSGGIATAVHLVSLAGPSAPQQVVLKLFPPGSPSPDREWSALEFVAGTTVPSPAPILLNAGEWFNAPCIVTDYLAGRPNLHPRDQRRWIDALAEALWAIHNTPIHDGPAWLHRPAIWDRWRSDALPPGPRTTAISSAVDTLRSTEWVVGFCHGDFHPGNVLFDDDSLVGIVDWPSARVAPLLSDLGRARAALAIWPGGEAPDQLAAAYAADTGRALDGLALWDVLSGAITLENADAVPFLYEALGVPLTYEDVHTRAVTFIDRALQLI